MALLDAELGAMENTWQPAWRHTHSVLSPFDASDGTAHFTTRTEDGVVGIVATLGDK